MCRGCNLEKEIDEFDKCKTFKDGYQYRCKSCKKEVYQKNKQNILKKLSGDSDVLRKKKEYRENNKEKIKLYNKKWKEENSESIKIYNREYKLKNRDKLKQYHSEYMIEYRKDVDNKKIISEKTKEHRKKNKDRYNEYQRKYSKSRKDKDPLYKLKKNLSALISHTIRRNGYTKKSKSFEILGCDFDFFISFIEDKFLEGMCWENYGDWHLDHIFPASLAKDGVHLIQLNHYTNFQPLWAKDNISKSNKITD